MNRQHKDDLDDMWDDYQRCAQWCVMHNLTGADDIFPDDMLAETKTQIVEHREAFIRLVRAVADEMFRHEIWPRKCVHCAWEKGNDQ